jgi:hypothetical protein
VTQVEVEILYFRTLGVLYYVLNREPQPHEIRDAFELIYCIAEGHKLPEMGQKFPLPAGIPEIISKQIKDLAR